MANLAINGHANRGIEVIEILEMLGGINELLLLGNGKGVYLIDSRDNIIYYIQSEDIVDDFTIFTLEEFLEKYPYKVGDKVLYHETESHITSMKWDNRESDIVYVVKCKEDIWGTWVSYLQPYKEETMKVSEEFFNKYCKKCGSQRCTAEGEWLEGCKHYKEETMKELRIDFPEGYGYAGIENKQVIFTKIKPEYPKTYGECHELMVQWKEYDCNPNSELILCDAPIHDFCKLIVARNIYWKIAGEQMGLGEPWQPDWENERYSIYRHKNNKIIKGIDVARCINRHVLEFPTEKMRDVFYENFKELIEECKELL